MISLPQEEKRRLYLKVIRTMSLEMPEQVAPFITSVESLSPQKDSSDLEKIYL